MRQNQQNAYQSHLDSSYHNTAHIPIASIQLTSKRFSNRIINILYSRFGMLLNTHNEYTSFPSFHQISSTLNFKPHHISLPYKPWFRWIYTAKYTIYKWLLGSHHIDCCEYNTCYKQFKYLMRHIVNSFIQRVNFELYSTKHQWYHPIATF